MIQRLNYFGSAMSKIQHLTKARGHIKLGKGSCLEVINVSVLALSNEALIKNITFIVKPTDKLLISGPTGIGKTTLFRTIAGVWPNFSGQIIKPAMQTFLFLPQMPYFPIDSLRNVLLYPYMTHPIADEQIAEVLSLCKLPRLIGKINQVEDWGRVLSLGEQQGLSFVRAILHQPDWLFLDEATSSMDKATEKHMYELIRTRLPTTALISIGHRETLHEYHNLNLQISSTGICQLLHSHNIPATGEYN